MLDGGSEGEEERPEAERASLMAGKGNSEE
jgi:hypothetical protein